MKNEIRQTLATLKEGKSILYPTDTVWGLGCDATNEKAVEGIYKLKQRAESKSLIILVDSLQMLQQYVSDIPVKAIEILKETTTPTTIIYRNPKGLAKNVVAKDNTVAIRIAKHNFCESLIKQFGKPIVSTSANISGNSTPKSFKEIDTAILDGVDYVVNLQDNKTATKSSKIIKILEDGTIDVLRN